MVIEEARASTAVIFITYNIIQGSKIEIRASVISGWQSRVLSEHKSESVRKYKILLNIIKYFLNTQS